MTTARDEIVDAARQLFTDVGYHATTIAEIAAATGRTTAAVRQEFPDTRAIFEVLSLEMQADLERHAARLAPVDADPAGLDELRIWIAGLSALIHRGSTTLRLWPLVEHGEPEPAAPGQPIVGVPFLRRFAAALQPGLVKVDTGALSLETAAAATLVLVEWAQLTRAAQMPAIGESHVDDHLARVLGNALLPDSPRPTWQRPPLPPPPDEMTPRRRQRQAPPEPLEGTDALVGLRRPLTTPRGRVTVDRVLRGAAEVIRRRGFRGTGLADVTAAAGITTRTFHAYWEDLPALFHSLAHRAVLALQDALRDLPRSDTGRVEFRGWIHRWVDLLEEHGPVLHVWVQESGNDIELSGLTAHLRASSLAIIDGLTPAEVPAESLERRIARVVMWALLVELPYCLCVQVALLDRDDIADVLALFLERGFPDRP